MGMEAGLLGRKGCLAGVRRRASFLFKLKMWRYLLYLRLCDVWFVGSLILGSLGFFSRGKGSLVQRRSQV